MKKMTRFKFFKRFIKCIFVFNFAFNSSGRVKTTLAALRPGGNMNETDRIPIGVVFDQNSNQIQHAFKIAMVQHANNNTPDYLNFQVFVDVINTADTFKLSRLVCNQFSRGVVSILASVHPDSFDTFHSYANTFHMPFVTPFFPEKVLTPTSGLPDYAMSILPDYHRAVLGTVTYYGWRNVIYLYDSHDGMLRLQQIFKSLVPGKTPFFRIANVKRIGTAQEIIIYLRQLEKSDRWSNKYVILDCSTTIAKETIITHVRDVQLGRRNYHYLFSGLVLDDRWDREVREYGTINMTGFRLVDTSRKFVKDFFYTWKLDSIAAKGALMYDAAHTVLEAFQRILKQKPHIMENLMNKTNNRYRFLNCDTQEAVPLKYGDEIAQFIKKTQVEGLSGKIRFTNSGVRKNFSLVVVQNTPDGNMTKIATWYDDRGFRPVRKMSGFDVSGRYDRNKTYTVVSIQEPPYFTASRLRRDSNEMVYGGFCSELAELIAEKLQISIQFRLSADGKYGNQNPAMIGGWDGMIGELVRKGRPFCLPIIYLLAMDSSSVIMACATAPKYWETQQISNHGKYPVVNIKNIIDEIDMVVAPLIVTAEREAVVDFSKPFLSFNRIGSKNPQKEKVPMFGFLKPLSKETWYLVGCSVVLVSIVMFVVSRFSPMEWRVVAVTDTEQSQDGSETPVTRASVINEFTLFNSVWYSVSSMMQQGTETVPRSVSGRIVSTVWWFFALIIVSSYTAFLASQLTINGIESPVLPVYNRMAHCPEDMLPEEKKANTIDDEVHGNAEALADAYMNEPSDYVRSISNCEVIITLVNPGIMDFAVAFPSGSKLRNGVNIALTAIREDGEMSRLIRKYFHSTDCGMPLLTGGPSELTLNEIVGLFYFLLTAMAVGLIIALVEFCTYHRSDAAKANIPIKTALRAKSRLPVAEAQEPRNPPRRRRRDQERGWNGTGTAPGSYAGSGPMSTPMTATEINTRNCVCFMKHSCQQVIDEQRKREKKPQSIRQSLPNINEQGTSEMFAMQPREDHQSTGECLLHMSFETPRRTPVTPMKAAGTRHVMTKQRSRQVLQQVQESRDAIELACQPYFTPTNQNSQEETAMHNSLAQV